MRTHIDENTGAKELRWHGRESFVKQMGQPGRRVVRLLDPKSRTVIWGALLPHYGTVGHYGQ
jgi:hypothetical protein